MATDSTLRWRALLTAEWITERIERGAMLCEMAAEAGCEEHTVRDAMRRHGLAFVGQHRGPIERYGDILTPDVLDQLYRVEGRSSGEIARRFGCATSTVLRHLDAAGIERRPPSSGHRVYRGAAIAQADPSTRVRRRKAEGKPVKMGRPPAMSAEQLAHLDRRHRSGETIASLAAELGIRPHILWNRLDRWRRKGART